MEQYIWVLILLGIVGLALPWLKITLVNFPVNLPMVAVVFGIILFALPINLPNPDPTDNEGIGLRVFELAVIISLMGTGLKLSRPFSFKHYRVPLILVFVTMIACIAAVAGVGWWLGFFPAAALLLGAVYTPTDPVIADEVQVEIEETEEQEHPVRFSLTAEAGINDGMAFPFTWFAIWAALEGTDSWEWVGNWFMFDFLYRIAAGLVLGWLGGKFVGWLYLILPEKINLKPRSMGFVAIAATFLVYGVTEALSGYGFIAVFVTSITMKSIEMDHEYHIEMHDFVNQVENMFVSVILILLGGYIVQDLFFDITTGGIILALLFIFVIRPVFAYLPLLAYKITQKDRWIIAFMGIKGAGSFFYLAYALKKADFPQQEAIWATSIFLIIISVFVHGITTHYIKPIIVEEEKNINTDEQKGF